VASNIVEDDKEEVLKIEALQMFINPEAYQKIKEKEIPEEMVSKIQKEMKRRSIRPRKKLDVAKLKEGLSESGL